MHSCWKFPAAALPAMLQDPIGGADDRITPATTTRSQCASKGKSCDVPCAFLHEELFLGMRISRWSLSGKQALAHPVIGGRLSTGPTSEHQRTVGSSAGLCQALVRFAEISS